MLIITYCTIEISQMPIQSKILYQQKFDTVQETNVNEEVKHLLKMKVIREIKRDDGEIISTILTERVKILLNKG